jgi:Patatin-like phospholipase
MAAGRLNELRRGVDMTDAMEPIDWTGRKKGNFALQGGGSHGSYELKLFVAATNVHTGRIKVFEGSELTADHVMASSCLPYLFQAVEIDEVPYWDGGFMGNPALFPLFYKTACPDMSSSSLTRSNGTRRHARRPTFRID